MSSGSDCRGWPPPCRAGARAGAAVSATFLAFLSGFPDSHVRRKFGLGVARTLCRRAGVLDRRLMREGLSPALQADLLKFDAELKAAGINPGTSADLTVATLFAAALQHGLAAAKPVT